MTAANDKAEYERGREAYSVMTRSRYFANLVIENLSATHARAYFTGVDSPKDWEAGFDDARGR